MSMSDNQIKVSCRIRQVKRVEFVTVSDCGAPDDLTGGIN